MDTLLSRLSATSTAGLDPVLDIACGAGRHLSALRGRGHAAYGIDLSRPLLASAGGRLAPVVVRGDMRRLPFRAGAFATALSMFTSLGYFRTPEEDAVVLAEAARVLKPGGAFVLDYLNAEWTRRHLVPEGERAAGPYRVHERRRIATGPDGLDRVEKTMVIEEGPGRAMTVREEVLLLDRADLTRLLEAAGFEVFDCLGDYDGSPFHPSDTPRALLLARRRAA